MLDQRSILIVISTLLAIISPIVYGRAILKGKAKPHRTTRLVLLIITSLSTISLLAQGDRVAVWLAGVSTFQSIIVFILSVKYGMGGWSRSDIVSLVIALLGIFLWKTTNSPAVALFASIAADFTGMVPTLIKTFYLPKTEVWYFNALDTVAGILTMAAVKSLTAAEIAYPFYIFVINFAMTLLIIIPRVSRPKDYAKISS